jgi:hypothetical protein
MAIKTVEMTHFRQIGKGGKFREILEAEEKRETKIKGKRGKLSYVIVKTQIFHIALESLYTRFKVALLTLRYQEVQADLIASNHKIEIFPFEL